MKRAIKHLFARKLGGGQRGAIAVEMAIVLPLFAILLTGTFEIGLMAQQHQILQNAAREGARFSSLQAQQMSGSPNAAVILTTIQNRVVNYLANNGITVAPGNVTVDQDFPVSIGALTVQGSHVTVTYTRPVLFNGSTTFFGLGSVVLQGDAIFRNFYSD